MAPVTRSRSLRDGRRKRRNEETGDNRGDYKKKACSDGVAEDVKSGDGGPSSSNMLDALTIIPTETEKGKPAVFFKGAFGWGSGQ